MSDEKSTLLSSRLYTEASADLEEKVEEEKKVPDPSPEEAAAALEAAEVKDED
jgi:hypothetical protein